ncbi:MAG: selenium-dependent molybdenum cofactor biosynthesis protein YqeB [Bacteroidota bacterium]
MQRAVPLSMSDIPFDLILVRGGGDLASGVVLRLHRSGLSVVISELPQPLAVRRAVAFSEAVYEGKHSVEGVTARRAQPIEMETVLEAEEIPVLVDPGAEILATRTGRRWAVVDGRMLKRPPAPLPVSVGLHIGLGPGFEAGSNCDAVIETRRSHTLGRVFWDGPAQADSGEPEGDPRRVLRAPASGTLQALARIGDHIEPGQTVAVVQTGSGGEVPVVSLLGGVLRGLIRTGIPLTEGVKVGDVDPRDDARLCFLVSDKALAIGGGVLEALLSGSGQDSRGPQKG